MASGDESPLVVKLPREAGKRESRYMHLFSGEVDVDAIAAFSPAVNISSDSKRIELLETEVAELKAQIEVLRLQVESLTS